MSPKPRGISLGLFSQYRDELFGLSILSIVLYHYCLNVRAHAPAAITEGYLAWIGAVGVEVFVFLSGMGLWYSFSRQPDAGAFYRRRLSRILPVYLPVAAVFWAVRGILEGTGFLRFLGNLTFVTFFTRGVHTIWYVGFILLLYLLYPLIHKFLDRPSVPSRAIHLLILYAAFAGIMVVYRHVAPAHYDRELMVWIRIPIFLTGCFLAPFIKEGAELPAKAVCGVMGALLAGKAVTVFLPRAEGIQVFYNTLYALALMLLVCLLLDRPWKARPAAEPAAATAEPAAEPAAEPSTVASSSAPAGPLRRCLQFFGAYSLELYVIHVCLRNLVNYKGWPIWNPGVYAAVILVSLGLSIGLHKLNERVLTDRKG